jgi:dolichyl-phosphate-mannose-protein mannosyltransferase
VGVAELSGIAALQDVHCDFDCVGGKMLVFIKRWRLLDAPADGSTTVTGTPEFDLLVMPLLIVAVLWTLVPTLVFTAPPLDVVEGALWGREWVIGTYKHPGMPSWLIEAGRLLDGGRVGWPVYATSQLFNCATLALTFFLARDLTDARIAFVAVVSLLGVEYFSWRSPEFNHTQAQMPFWIASVWSAWRALQTGNRWWWVALALVSAAGLYAKLSNVILLCAILGWLLASTGGRSSFLTTGPWLSAILFGMAVIPLTLWLISNGFQPLSYASVRAQKLSLERTLTAPLNLLLQCLPVFLVLIATGVLTPGLKFRPRRCSEADDFLLAMALAPPLLSVSITILDGSSFRPEWFAPDIPLLAVLLVSRCPEQCTASSVMRLRICSYALATIMPLAYGLLVVVLGHFDGMQTMRVRWPQELIARQISDAWSRRIGKPLKIVAGSAWPAGLVGLNHSDRPSILTEGRTEFSPWITPERLRREGALAVWVDGGMAKMPRLQKLIEGLPVGDLAVPVAEHDGKRGLIVHYAILPPE